jgi:hypothetical protein
VSQRLIGQLFRVVSVEFRQPQANLLMYFDVAKRTLSARCKSSISLDPFAFEAHRLRVTAISAAGA